MTNRDEKPLSMMLFDPEKDTASGEWDTRCPRKLFSKQCGKHRGHSPPCTVAEIPGYPWSKHKRSRRPNRCH